MPGSAGAFLTSYVWANSSVVSPKLKPALKAARFASRMGGFAANFFWIHLTVTSVGREYIHDTSPSANMFLARSASFFEMSRPSVARRVIEVMGTR